jgi:hypothetical protein
LNDGERADILRAAIGYALGDETIGLSRLREKYQAKFSDGPDRRAFDIVTAPTGTGSAEFKDVVKKIASVDTLDAFLRDLRARYPESSAVSPAGAAGADSSAADKPKTPMAHATAADPAGKTAPETSGAGSSPLPRKAPAGTPMKPDKEPTGSISRLPKVRAKAQ